MIAPKAVVHRPPKTLLGSEPFIRYDRRHWGGRLADGYLRHVGLVPRDRFELDALESIAVMVDRGLGVSIVPDWAPPWPEGLQLAKWVIPAPDFRRRVGLAFLKGSARMRPVKAFLSDARAQRPGAEQELQAAVIPTGRHQPTLV